MKLKVFDAHCHLQDPKIFSKAPQLIATAIDAGVARFAVNGTHEKDWNLVKEMSEQYDTVVPDFGLHPWFVAERSPTWFSTLMLLPLLLLERTVTNAIHNRIGLDKGATGRQIDFTQQVFIRNLSFHMLEELRLLFLEVQVFQQQLELAKTLKRPASIHCVRAFGDLLQIVKETGPFPDGIILHSYLGSAEMVPEFAKLGAYFSLWIPYAYESSKGKENAEDGEDFIGD